MSEIIVRSAEMTDVDPKLRLIDLIAVPWDEEAEVVWRGEVWREVFRRGAFNGIENHAGRVPVNREHVKGDTVGKVVHLDPASDIGLLARVKIVRTARGDDTLALAEEQMLAASVGYYTKEPRDVLPNKRTMFREVLRAFLDHLGLVETPAYAGAQVLAVREASPGLTVTGNPPPETPALDDAMNSPVLSWARDRISAK